MPTVVITGASTGIGEACAIDMAAQGWDVYAGVRKADDGERVAAHDAARITPLLIDVTNHAQVAEAAEKVGADVGGRGIDGLVNNAGIALGGPIEYIDDDVWRRQFDVNVFGTLAVTRAFLPLIRDASGRTVFIGSMGGRIPVPHTAPYIATKHALEGIADCLRGELRSWKLKVSIVQPGAVSTPIWEKGQNAAAELVDQLPDQATERYDHVLSRVDEALEKQNAAGVAPSKVADAVRHALTARRPKTRYPVGSDAKMGMLLRRVVPDELMDLVVRLQTGF